MSDTLRTDTLLIAHDMSPEPEVLINHARDLERELNAANARIKQLEEYIIRLEEVGDYWIPADINAWRKAKEAKP